MSKKSVFKKAEKLHRKALKMSEALEQLETDIEDLAANVSDLGLDFPHELMNELTMAASNVSEMASNLECIVDELGYEDSTDEDDE